MGASEKHDTAYHGATTTPVTVTVDADELRKWADRHADLGHHGVAHVLFKAAKGVESVTEQHDREVAAQALDDAALTWQTGDWANAPRRTDRVQERLAAAQHVTDWLRGRARATRALCEHGTSSQPCDGPNNCRCARCRGARGTGSGS